MKSILNLIIALIFCAGAASAQISNITQTPQGIAYNAAAKTVTSAYTVTDKDHTVLASANSGAFSISLPAVSAKKYNLVVIKKTDAGSNEITIDAYGSQTIDGSTTYVLSRQYQSVELHSNGTGWSVLSRESGAGVLRKLYLGTPRAAEAARAVSSANMKVGTYTIANQPDMARNVSVTHTAVSTVDTLGRLSLSARTTMGLL